MKTTIYQTQSESRSARPFSNRRGGLFRHLYGAIVACLGLASFAPDGYTAGTLTPKGSPHQPIRILDHHVKVALNNGFAQTEVTQTFFNPNDQDLEADYRFPLPKSASLSEVTLSMGEREIEGEVVERGKAETIYETEKQAGNDAGLATKDGYQAFEFRVHPVRAQDQTRIRIVYYQPIEIDTGIGRYLYPLEEGGDADGYWRYPTKSNTIPAVGTVNAIGDITNYDGSPIANYSSGADWDSNDDGVIENGNVTTVGSGGAGSASFYRGFDMAGNVFEWNEAIIAGTTRGMRGGLFSSAEFIMRSTGRSSDDPTTGSFGNGFRVAIP